MITGSEATGRYTTGQIGEIVSAAAVNAADDAALLAPNSTEGRSREMFPTIGAVVGKKIARRSGGRLMDKETQS